VRVGARGGARVACAFGAALGQAPSRDGASTGARAGGGEVLASAIPGSGGTSNAARHFAAIAVSSSTLEYGFSFRFPSRKQAEEAALTYGHGNATKPRDCKIGIGFWNTCGSLAIEPESSKGKGDGAWGTAWDASRESARNKALASCVKSGGANCKTAVTFCASQ